MELLIITGLSGAGKTQVTHTLEDIGYFCIDNIPAKLIPPFADLVSQVGRFEKIAVVTDLRTGELFGGFFDSLSELRRLGIDYKILYLYADIDVLERRYSESRRRHPLAGESISTRDAIHDEIELMKPVAALADYNIDTSILKTAQLKDRVLALFSYGDSASMLINCVSFGFKHGLPSDSDLVLDVRCLPNPFYEPDLKEKTGLQKEVADYVLQNPMTIGLVDRAKDMLQYLIPLYIKEGKSQLVVSIGCTGGHHRSVAVTHALAEHIRALGYEAGENHRDMTRV